MNTTTYLFGKLGQEYFQYPNDYTKSMFQDFYEKANSKTQILIHRQDSLMYYSYIRKLDIDESQYIGMCIVLNGVMFEDIRYLFQTFEKAFIYLVLASEFLIINDKGDIVQTDQKYLQLDEINAVRDILEKRVSSFNNKLVNLPPVDYSKASSESKSFTFNDSNQSIINSTYRYSYTYIYKDKEYDTPSLFNYKSVISQLKTEKNKLSKQYEALTSEHKKVIRKEKQYSLISILYVGIAILLIGVISLNNNNLEKDRAISIKENIISNNKKNIEKLENDISDMKKRESNLELDIRKQYEEKNILANSIDSIEHEKQKNDQNYYDLQYQVSILRSENYKLQHKIENLEYIQASIKRQKDHIEEERKKLEQKCNDLQYQLTAIKNEQKEIQRKANAVLYDKNQAKETYATVATSTPLLTRPDNSAFVITKIYGNKVRILSKAGDSHFYYVEYNNSKGYIWEGWVIRINK